jgi:DNA phosphorothioation-dependent restriction protein DptG
MTDPDQHHPDWLFFTQLEQPNDQKHPHYRKYERNCPKGHLFYAPNLTKPCPTCTSRESYLCEQLRAKAEDLFETPFSRVSPNWAIHPQTQRRITFKLYSPDLNLVIDCQVPGVKKFTREDLCKQHNTYYLYITNANIKTKLKAEADQLKEHLFNQLNEARVTRVVKKIDSLLMPPFGFEQLHQEPLDYKPPLVSTEFEQTLNQLTRF